MDRIRHMATRTSTPPNQADEALRRTVAAQIGPRTPGTVYDNSANMFEVLEVVTDPAEARRLLHRDSAQFAVFVRDLESDYRYYTGAVWTSSDYVLKAVA
jgi:hypothetical protein